MKYTVVTDLMHVLETYSIAAQELCILLTTAEIPSLGFA